jgi:hypothetical protein
MNSFGYKISYFIRENCIPDKKKDFLSIRRGAGRHLVSRLRLSGVSLSATSFYKK